MASESLSGAGAGACGTWHPRRDDAATSVEYVILLVGVGLAVTAGGPALWRGLLAVFNAILFSMGAR